LMKLAELQINNYRIQWSISVHSIH
jgi:hypothetical protein